MNLKLKIRNGSHKLTYTNPKKTCECVKMALRRFLRRNPWIIVTLGCLLVIAVILDAGRRTGEFQKHHERYHGSQHKEEISIIYQNETYVLIFII